MAKQGPSLQTPTYVFQNAKVCNVLQFPYSSRRISLNSRFCYYAEYLILKETQSRIAKLRDEIIKEIRGMNPLKEVSKEDDHLNKIIVELQLKIDKAIDETENVWKEVELMGKNSIVEMKNLRSEIENVKKKENLQWKVGF